MKTHRTAETPSEALAEAAPVHTSAPTPTPAPQAPAPKPESHIPDHIADTLVPPGTLPVDEFTGVGGDYVIGADGKRRRVEPETVPPAAV